MPLRTSYNTIGHTFWTLTIPADVPAGAEVTLHTSERGIVFGGDLIPWDEIDLAKAKAILGATPCEPAASNRTPAPKLSGTTRERLETMIREQFLDASADHPPITDAATLAGDLDLDSLDKVELLMAVEEEFGIEFAATDDEHFLDIVTFGNALDFIEEQLAEQTQEAA